MASIEKEDWFGQTNKYSYHDLMIALYEKDTIDLKAAHAKLGGTGVWIDTGRFTKGTRLHNPNKLFDLFSEYSRQTADEVCDLMIGWIYDNYRNVKGWTRMAMQHKNININKWLRTCKKLRHMVMTSPCTYYRECSTNMYSYTILSMVGVLCRIARRIITRTL